ncbi:MAG TPA: helix-hairpin-helix domain-containing protein, partial [Gemmatales bacterium]|nr:helix-hairpin-helix domain-containing protein [Gemmatales bacterium]
TIRHVGVSNARLLAAEFGSMEALQQASEERLSQIEGIGPIVAASVRHFFEDAGNLHIIQRLQSAGVKMTEEMKPAQTGARGSSFAGKSFVVTGTLEKFGRDEIEQLIRDLGGKTSSSVSKKTSYVVAGEKAGSKLEKAQELGITVLSEDEFLKMAGR